MEAHIELVLDQRGVHGSNGTAPCHGRIAPGPAAPVASGGGGGGGRWGRQPVVSQVAAVRHQPMSTQHRRRDRTPQPSAPPRLSTRLL